MKFNNRDRKGLMYAILGAMLVWFGFAGVFDELLYGAISSIGFGAAVFALWRSYPEIKLKRKAEEIEAELPFALMAFAVEVNMNQPFEKCVESIAKGNYGLLSREFDKIAKKVKEAGCPVQEALFEFAESTKSMQVKRAVAQMVAAYEQGARKEAGRPLKRIAIEQFAKQRAVAKEFSGKMVVFSLMFIALSAIVPALFLAYMVVGSTFMDLDFEAWHVIVIGGFIFPAVDLAMLYLIRSKTPIFLRSG